MHFFSNTNDPVGGILSFNPASLVIHNSRFSFLVSPINTAHASNITIFNSSIEHCYDFFFKNTNFIATDCQFFNNSGLMLVSSNSVLSHINITILELPTLDNSLHGLSIYQGQAEINFLTITNSDGVGNVITSHLMELHDTCVNITNSTFRIVQTTKTNPVTIYSSSVIIDSASVTSTAPGNVSFNISLIQI